MSTITWRNVDKLSSDDMGRAFMADAQKSGNTALDGLGGILKNFQATADANQVQAKENATNEFMRQLLSAKNSQELTGMAPTLNDMLTARGAGMDQRAALQAMDARTGVMQARDTATTAFNTAQEVEKQRPLVEQWRMLDRKKDAVGKAAFEAANPGIRNMSALYDESRTIDEGTTKIALDTDVARQNIAASISNAAANTSKAATESRQADIHEADYKIKAYSVLAERAASFDAKAKEVSAGTVSSPEGSKAVLDRVEILLGKREIGDKAVDALRSSVGAALADPKNRTMTVTDFLAAVEKEQDGRNWIGRRMNNDSDYGKTLSTTLENIRVGKDYGKVLAQRQDRADANTAQATQFKTMMAGIYPNLAEAANPTGGVFTPPSVVSPAPVTTETDKRKEAVKSILNSVPEYVPPPDSQAGRVVQQRREEVADREAKLGTTKKDIKADVSAALEIADPVQRREQLAVLQRSSDFADLPVNTQAAVFKSLNGLGTKKQK